MKNINLLLYIICCVAFVQNVFSGESERVCSYQTNESMVKFRKKTVGDSKVQAQKYCVDKDIIGPNKLYFDWPINTCHYWISSLYGHRTHKGVTRMHKGIDMAAPTGTSVRSAAGGKVLRVERDVAGYGNVIEILHKEGMVTRYGHLDEFLVQKGQKVARAEQIATVGSTGNARGSHDPSHLHFEILNKENKQVDPLVYLYCSEVAFQN